MKPIRLKRKVAGHAISRNGIKAALEAGVDSIEHGSGFDDSLIDQAKAQGVYWCPTLLVFEHILRTAVPCQAACWK